MDLKFKRKNKTLIILIAGEIDHHSSKELRSKTESALEQMGRKKYHLRVSGGDFHGQRGHQGVNVGRYKQVAVLRRAHCHCLPK